MLCRKPSGSRKACFWFLGSGSLDQWGLNAVGLVFFCCFGGTTGVKALNLVFLPRSVT